MQLEIYSLIALKDQISVSLEAICDSYSSLLWDIEFYQCGCFEVYIAASPQNVSIFQMNKNWEVQFKGWIPIVDGGENKDILKYNGIFQVAANYRTDNRRFNCGVILTKRKTWFSFNTQIELSYKFNNNENQYFFLQYYNGYGENLLEYNQYKSMLRIGFVIKPQDFSIY